MQSMHVCEMHSRRRPICHHLRAVAHQVYDEDGVAADDDDDDLSHMRLDLIICFPFVSVQWTGCRAPL